MKISQFRIVFEALVAENKKLFSKTIQATPIEEMPFLDGEIRHDPQYVTTEGVDSQNNHFTEKVITSLTIEANWLPLNSNRKTAPDVRRGERVQIWQAGNSDKYYWTSLGLDEKLRKLETVVLGFSANPNESADGDSPENMYFIEVNTHSKHITLQTSDKNGEPFKYTFQFNTGEGVVSLLDDVGNMFEMDSKATKLTLKNKDGTTFSLDKKNIKGHAPNSIDFKANNNITFTCGGSMLKLMPSEVILKTPKFTGEL